MIPESGLPVRHYFAIFEATFQYLFGIMKAFAKKLVLNFLMLLARIRLKRLRPYVIGVTGSVGKTSTKDAIHAILKNRYYVSSSEKSYNTEFGLPLSVLGQESGFSSPWAWFGILCRSVWSAFFSGRGLKILILELGVDKPGDMGQLLKMVKPQVGVITGINPVHLAEGQFKDLEDIFNEKKKLVEALPQKGVAVLNGDDPYLIALRDKLECRVIYYGFSEICDLRAVEANGMDDGIQFKVVYKDQVATGVLPVLGIYNVYTALAAVAVALSQGFELEESVAFLKDYKLPAGRMNPIKGIHDTLIIDSSYNSSPSTVKEALNVLSGFNGRKIAVLGNMNELGDSGETKHREMGRYAAEHADMILTVGDLSKIAGDEAKAAGFEEDRVLHFENALQAADRLKKIIQKGDIILVKGSQNKVRLERLVKAIMEEPLRAKELLVRQEAQWQNID
jgi:UDP-N-acetylmuramoyl-tripeptide--D-alanyl-D-alanine ligase